MVEQEAVNFEVVGSSPTPGAMKKESQLRLFFLAVPRIGTSNRRFVRKELSQKLASRKSRNVPQAAPPREPRISIMEE